MTSIEWTDRTWNPVRGCSRVSAGCDHCYAIRQARRQDRPGGAYEGLTRARTRVDWSGVVRMIPEKIHEPLSWRKPSRVFVNSMSDLFHESLSFEDVGNIFSVMQRAKRHTFQVLTKRPQQMLETLEAFEDQLTLDERGGVWPLLNVWLGVSVEDQKTADERIPILLRTPAAIRFVSYEPALGPIEFQPFLFRNPAALVCPKCLYFTNRAESTCPNDCTALGPDIALDWVIVGGESGPGARPCDVAWIRSAVDQCRAAGVPVFVKQLGRVVQTRNDSGFDGNDGEWPVGTETSDSASYQGAPCRAFLRDRKGGDPEEWPEDLRIREFPY